MFSTFYSIWTNPKSKIFSLIKYLLENSTENSRTWAIHMRQISVMYGLEDPLICLNKKPPSKNDFKETVMTKISAYHEKELRNYRSKNDTISTSEREFFNVSLLGLRGRLHPAITNVSTSHSVRKMRPHVKMLIGNYVTFEMKSQQSGDLPIADSVKTMTEILSQTILKWKQLSI